MPAFNRITRDLEVMNGRPCIRDTRVAVTTILSLMATGRTEVEIARRFPALAIDDIREALTFAAWEIDPSGTVQGVTPEAARPLLPPQPRYLQPPKPQPAEEEKKEIQPQAPEAEVTVEFFHPSRPDQPTVLLTSHGIIDRRWSTGMIAWSDIRDIRRIPGEKTIVITLRNPSSYLSALPFFRWMLARIRLALNLRAIYLDAASLGLATHDLLDQVTRLWLKYRVRKRKRHRPKHRRRRRRSLLAEGYQAD